MYDLRDDIDILMEQNVEELLSSAQKNQEIINSFRPFEDEETLNKIKGFYKINFVYESNTMEGFSCTKSETKLIIEDGISVGGRRMKDIFAVTGHADAYDYMFKLLHKDTVEENDILFMHRLLTGSLENNAVPGHYRTGAVYIGGTDYIPPPHSKVKTQMDNLFNYIKENKDIDPLVLASRFHKELAYIHPFDDGNGRVARLGLNTLLIQRSYLPVIIPISHRVDYYDGLEKGHKNDTDFIKLIAALEISSQKNFSQLLEIDLDNSQENFYVPTM